MDEEKKKPKPELRPLIDMKEAHKKVTLLTKAIKNKSQQSIPIEKVPSLREQLLNLKHSGKSFRAILNANKKLKE